MRENKIEESSKPSLFFSLKGAAFPIFPLLYICFPFLHLWAENFSRGMAVEKFVYPFFLSFAGALFLLLFLFMIYRNFLKASITAVLMLIVFFSYGHLYLNFLGKFNLHPRLPAAMFIIIFFLVPLLTSRIRTSLKDKDGQLWTAYLNLVFILLLLIPMTKLATASRQVAAEELTIPEQKLPQITSLPANLPDIYYIVPDEYARQDILKTMFKYDNEPFLKGLEERGFYTARKSNSNYPATIYSLASSLSFNYLHDNIDYAFCLHTIRNSPVMWLLRRIGYKYYFVNSGQTITEFAQTADKLISYWGADEVRLLFINSTLLRAFSTLLLSESWRDRHLYNFRELGEVPPDKGPKFVFAHMILPHPPIVFKGDGSLYSTFTMTFTPRSKIPRAVARYMNGYAGQVEYTNVLLTQLVDNILKKSEIPPVIIIQSDHGVDPLDDFEAGDNLHKRMANFTAIYAEPELQKKLYPGITPVNIFRIVFDHYFGTDLGRLPDRSFMDSYETDSQDNSILKWKDITPKTV